MVLTSQIRAWRVAAVMAAALVGQSALASGRSAEAPGADPGATVALMAARDTTASAPILMRAYKKEESSRSGRRPGTAASSAWKPSICRWSGQLGPKRTIGDRQTPGGVLFGRASADEPEFLHLSFDIGFPNAYDRAHGGTGAYLMVHGNCSSAGCFAMTDKAVEEIYALAREAFAGGQQAFQFSPIRSA